MGTISNKSTIVPKNEAKRLVRKPLVKKGAPADEDDQYFSRAVSKAFLILDLLNAAATPVALNDMATQVGLTKSSCFRLLHTLGRLQYVAQGADGRYTVARTNRVSPAQQVTNALLRGPDTPARDLNEKFRETVSVAVLFTNHIEVVQVYESSWVLRMANTVGRIIPPHASSLGKAITAFQTEAVCKKLLVSYGLQPLTKHSITDEVMLREELRRIREQGFAFEGEESSPDGCCYGAPIFVGGSAASGEGEATGGEVENAAVAAVSISMPKSRVPSDPDRAHMIADLRAAAETLGVYLGSALTSGYSHELARKSGV